MSNIGENIIQFLNRILRRNSTLMLSNISQQNYNEFRKTYDTLSKICSSLDEIDAYLIGGISAAIQTNQDLYRQNSDIDIMCKEEDLSKLIELLQKAGYSVDDRRGIKTRNSVDSDGHFQAMDHELNANTKHKNLLGVGIFTYQVNGNEVITHSYAFEEKEKRVVGTEKVMPRELFDLMYDSSVVDYKGMRLRTQSKEYIYLSKNKGSREKDKLDATVIQPTLDEKSKEKIARIRELESQTRLYKILYGKDGQIESKTKYPTIEERITGYLDILFMNSSTKTPSQIIEDVLQSDEYHKVMVEHPEVDRLIDNWKEKSKNYTYRNKIELLTNNYSSRLEGFSKAAIDNALDFLEQRRKNHGKNNNDIELSDEAKEIFKLMQEYGKSIKKIFVDNNIDITHITDIAPEKLEGGELRKSIDRANDYETERVDGVFASSSPVDGNNLYIARNRSGVIRIGKSSYIYGSDNIEVTKDAEGKTHAMLKQPNYVYHINPANFIPVCNLTIDPNTGRPVFEFSEEWISDTAIDIYDPNQVRGVDEVKDVTSLLENYTVLCDVQSQGIAMDAKKMKSREDALQYIIGKINDGSIRNINQEAGINVRDLSGMDR